MDKKNILLVDDETNILRSLKRALAGSPYQVYTAESGEEALNLFSSQDIDLLITDIRMPGMTGYQLLKEVKAKYPSVIRLVLSGYPDEHELLKIQRSCLAKLFILKPWQNQELLKTIENVFSVEQILNNKKVLEKINNIDFLLSPDSVYHQFNELVEKNADMKQIVAAIERDPSTAAKVLQVVNSAFFGKKTGSVQQAAVYLGLNSVKDILMNCCLYQELNHTKNPRLKRDLDTLWQHAVLTNRILHDLYLRVFNEKIPETCSSAGLLHDVGKVIILSKYTHEYAERTKTITTGHDVFYYYEELEFLETTHPEIGGYLLNWWELPYSIVEAAMFHHCPMDDKVINHKLVSLVHMADIFSWNMVSDQELRKVEPEVIERLYLKEEDIDKMFQEIKTSDS
ncbi:HDOD domain-containing protein [Desulfosporosinus lacus]|uniref:Stage 0 sporulation protein A homolog n=1 Tax=Desulfosporosinus lacus DSM 15449 TaxID=1121420 RepID=A0A1M5ZUB0_9FIRM|nr:HDOD domain-containing protein [Desulfosporosinus lacus]SHI27728.1 HD-like signal output (HDOD) domain, no enzymatic activity [Desulfosporosinus lacus DSM 15449]